MKKQLLMVLMILPAVLYTAWTSAAETVFYVQSANATVLSAPKFGSKVIARVAKGESLTSVSQEGRWIKVSVDGKIGFISSFLVSNHPPLAKQTIIKADEVDEIKPNARRRASSFTSAAAARGLTTDENKEEADKNAPDYKALEKMEAVKVTPAEVTKFKETGK